MVNASNNEKATNDVLEKLKLDYLIQCDNFAINDMGNTVSDGRVTAEAL